METSVCLLVVLLIVLKIPGGPAAALNRNLQNTSEIFGHTISFEDNSGRGILIAAPQVYLYTYANVLSVPSQNNADATYTLYYRFVKVGLSEYLGIIQSQTQAQRLA